METGKENKKTERVGNSVVYILLPFCEESDYDVFLNALKCVVGRVGRAKFTEHFVDNAFKSGLTALDIVINEDDILLSWKSCYSKEKLIKQSKLLAFWTRNNYPKFGKIFLGDDWQSPKRNFVKCETAKGTRTMTETEIDNGIFPRMNCHVVQLNVCASTLMNLKHFVRVPINEIDVENQVRISQRLTCFDVGKNFVEKCWTALRRGEWIGNAEVDSIQLEPHPKKARMHPQTACTYVGDTTQNLMKSSFSNNAMQSCRDAPIDLSFNIALVTHKLQEPVVNKFSTRAITSNEQLEFTHSSNDVPVDLSTTRTAPKHLQVEVAPTTTPELQAAPTTQHIHATSTTQELQERVHALERQLLTELQKSVVSLESELSKKKSYAVELEHNNRDLKLQLSGKNETLTTLQESVGDLQFELAQKNESLSNIEKINRALQLQLTQKDESLEIQVLQSDLKTKGEFLADAHKRISALESELSLQNSLLAGMELQFNAKNQLLADVQKSNVSLQAELDEKKLFLDELENNNQIMQSEIHKQSESLVANEKSNQGLQFQLNEKNCLITEMKKTIDALQLELTQKNESLAEIKQLNQTLDLQLSGTNVILGDVQKTVVDLESELSRKTLTLTEMQESNQDLQLQLRQTKEVVSGTQKSIVFLESELSEKKSTLAEIENFKTEIAESIVALEKELNAKDVILANLNEKLLQSQNNSDIQTSTQPNQIQSQLESNNIEIEKSRCHEPNALPSQLVEVNESSHQLTALNQATSEEVFDTEDPIVKECRPLLLRLEFGWIKFNKKEKFRPGFAYPLDLDGERRALEVTSDGYTSDEKLILAQFEKDIPETKKTAAQIKKLKLLNKKFKFSFT